MRITLDTQVKTGLSVSLTGPQYIRKDNWIQFIDEWVPRNFVSSEFV